MESGKKNCSSARSAKKEVPFGRGNPLLHIDELRQVLTDKRVELLRLVHTAKPDSIKELAQLTKRDFKNVNADVHLLARLGLLDLDGDQIEGGPRSRKTPRISYTTVSVEIPLV